MDASGTKLEKGLLLGFWMGGPWLGIKTNASDSLMILSLGSYRYIADHALCVKKKI